MLKKFKMLCVACTASSLRRAILKTLPRVNHFAIKEKKEHEPNSENIRTALQIVRSSHSEEFKRLQTQRERAKRVRIKKKKNVP